MELTVYDKYIRLPQPTGSTPSPARRFEMTGGTGGKLAQEIQDEFLLCKICLEAYKNPKSLDCLHTFCEKCIENHVMSESTYKKYSDYRDFTCPLCRKRTQLPIGGVKKLPDNFLVSNLAETISRQKPSKFPFCDICKMVSHKHKEAASKCLDCAKLLCKQCVDLHKDTKVTSSHNIFDIEIEKDIECKAHQDEVVRFYCEPCETCICVLCTFNEHREHEITQFGEAVAKYRDNIQSMLDGCRTKITRFDEQLVSINRVSTVIKAAEQKVHDTALKFISEIRQREKQLIEELANMYGKDLMDFVELKDDMTTSVEGLRSTCNLTEVILKGKDIELLLLKKDVQKKLTSLGDVEIRTLPSTVSKTCVFVPGEVDLGVVEDKDRPIASKLRAKMKQSIEAEISGVDKEMQTEPVKINYNASSSESDSESEDDSEGESHKKVEVGIQTENTDSESSDSESEDDINKDMIDQSTETDDIPTEEKAVNTRSRSMQQQSISQDGACDEEHMAARRRRRRERAATTQFFGAGYATDSSTDTNSVLQGTQNLKPSSFAMQNQQMAAAGVASPQMGMSTPQMGMSTPQMGMGTPQMGISTPQMGMSSSQPGHEDELYYEMEYPNGYSMY